MTNRLCTRVFVAAFFLLAPAGSTMAIEESVAIISNAFPASAVVKIPGCTAVLISPSWLLTIAHCVDDYSDRSIRNDRDTYMHTGRTAEFKDLNHPTTITMDRVVRVDGASTLTNSLALLHLSHPAPPWAEPIALYRGGLPDPDERLDIWGYGGTTYRGYGGVKIAGAAWQDSQKFWGVCLEAAPSYIVHGDSGGPIFINRNGRKEVIGINWNLGSCRGTVPGGGRAAAAFDYAAGGHSNPVGFLIDQHITEPMGHSSASLDVDGDGKNEIVLYDSHSGELRLLGIGADTRFEVRLVEQLPPGFQFLEVGNFNGDAVAKSMVLYRGDTGELRVYLFKKSSGNYFLIPWLRYPTLADPLVPENAVFAGASAIVPGDFNGDGITDLALIDRQNNRIQVVTVYSGRFHGYTSQALFGQAQVFAAGKFSVGATQDWLAACTISDTAAESTVNFFSPVVDVNGNISFALQPSPVIEVSGKVSQMAVGRFGPDSADDLFIYKSVKNASSPMRWYATVYNRVGTAPRTQMNVMLDTQYNMIIPGNFDSDTYSEMALWRRAYDSSRQAMEVYNIDGRSAMNKLSGRVWNWTNRWWTHMK